MRMSKKAQESSIFTAERIANVAQTGAVAFNAYKLFKMAIGMIIIVAVFVILMLSGLPWYIGLPAIAFVVLIFVLQVISLKRIASARL